MSSIPTEFGDKLEKIYILIKGEQYGEALNLLEKLSEAEKEYPMVLFYKALCNYENGSDFECVQLLAEFIHRDPRNEKRDYSLFTMAVCLINLGMEEDALKILKALPLSYPDLTEELLRTESAIQRKNQAREYISAL